MQVQVHVQVLVHCTINIILEIIIQGHVHRVQKMG